MGADFYAQPFFGIPVELDDLYRRTPNPLWGKFKFDPDTGKKVEEFLAEKQDADELAEKYGLQTYSTTDSLVHFFGLKLSKQQLDHNRDHYIEFSPLQLKEPENIDKKLRKLCEGMNWKFIEPKYYVIGHCSY